ncbi:MAG: hypothetical protein AAB393_03700, partial [Bacteroidota bacterium]
MPNKMSPNVRGTTPFVFAAINDQLSRGKTNGANTTDFVFQDSTSPQPNERASLFAVLCAEATAHILIIVIATMLCYFILAVVSAAKSKLSNVFLSKNC